MKYITVSQRFGRHCTKHLVAPVLRTRNFLLQICHTYICYIGHVFLYNLFLDKGFVLCIASVVFVFRCTYMIVFVCDSMWRHRTIKLI